ncbi:glycosyltransferase family 4 protein [Flavimarina sp. Hel_I_48]|uniref:glycosyltransferase family 4 protein n=1 Tax=Flavimarina sp. Hel_I_48 TaxID=1392488 RepID=UPI0004DF21A4|nr:glycosyltransferase family 4 protein [Flavimarina sp. Hel_I_48]
MKILLLVDDYLPQSTKIGAKMMHELGVALIHSGHSVSVVTPDHRIDKNYVHEVLDGVNVYRFKSGDVKAESKIKRAINETLLSYNAWRHLKDIFIKNPCELIVYYSPSIFFGSLVNKLKQKWSARSYLILRDIFPQWVIDHGMIKEKSIIATYFRAFERKNYKAADSIGLQSPKNLEWFQNKFGLKNKTEVLYNWSSEKPVINSNNSFRIKYHLTDKIVLFYGGNMGEAQDMMNLVRLAQKLSNYKNAHFVFAGSGNEFDLVKESIEKFSLTNILLLEPVNQKTYRMMLSEFDIGLFTLHKEHSTYNFPGKLLGYMSQGLPILGSVNNGNDVVETIENAGAGFVTYNGNDNKFLENTRYLLDNDQKRIEMGNNSLDLLKTKFSVEAAVDKVTQI